MVLIKAPISNALKTVPKSHLHGVCTPPQKLHPFRRSVERGLLLGLLLFLLVLWLFNMIAVTTNSSMIIAMNIGSMISTIDIID